MTGRPISYVWGNEQRVFTRCAGAPCVISGGSPALVCRPTDGRAQGRRPPMSRGSGGVASSTSSSQSGWQDGPRLLGSGSRRLVRDAWPQPISGVPTAVRLSDRQALVAKGTGGYPMGPVLDPWQQAQRRAQHRHVGAKARGDPPACCRTSPTLTVLGRIGSGRRPRGSSRRPAVRAPHFGARGSQREADPPSLATATTCVRCHAGCPAWASMRRKGSTRRRGSL